MNTATITPRESLERGYGPPAQYLDTPDSSATAVSWSAITAGAAATAALSLILLFLGAGLGLSSVSPWAHEGIRGESFGRSTIIWLALTQLIASGLGGYLAGRLRVKWIDTKRDEVYFRDTAHGFLAWAMATLLTAALLASVGGAILGRGVQAGASAIGSAAGTVAMAANSMAVSDEATTEGSGPWAYFIDLLFRPDATAVARDSTASVIPEENSDRTMAENNAEVARIFTSFSRTGPLPPADISYIAQLVAQRTGLSQRDAEKRVADVYARAQTTLHKTEVAAREAADLARKASAYAALWIFVSLLLGAFIASLAATCGGRQRDA